MKEIIKIYLLTLVILCPLALLSSCSKAVLGKYIGSPDFKMNYSTYSSLELSKGKTFILSDATTSFEFKNESTSITEISGVYHMSNKKLIIEPSRTRTGQVVYIPAPLKNNKGFYEKARLPTDSLFRTRSLIPVDTIYGEYQSISAPQKKRFKKYTKDKAIYFVSEGVIFSKIIKTGKPIDEKNKCPRLDERSKAPVNSY